VDSSAVAKLEVEPGTLPETMAAWVIRQEREGEPNDAFQLEQVEVPEPGAFEVIVRVMAAGVNFNNVWAALGIPVNMVETHRKDQNDHSGFHIGGSDASGLVYKSGANVQNIKVGDEVAVHCGMWDVNNADITSGTVDPIVHASNRSWGYEVNYGSFAQFTKVQAHQCLKRPQHMSWEESAAYMLVGATALAFSILLLEPSLRDALRTFWDRTVAFQFDRDSPFSIWDWGQYHALGIPDLASAQTVVQVCTIVLAGVAAVVPRRKGPLELAALTASLLLAFELSLTHWFYLYLPWVLPFVLLALFLPREPRPDEALSA
jgi:hypothetical protein